MEEKRPELLCWEQLNESARREAVIDLVVSVLHSKPLLVMTGPKCDYEIQSLKSSQVEMRQRNRKGRLSAEQTQRH